MKKKLVITSLVLILICSLFQQNIFAGEKGKTEQKTTIETGETEGSGGKTGGKNFDFEGEMDSMLNSSGDEEVLAPVEEIAGTAITVMQVVAIGVAIIMLIVLAMKYMTSAPDDKATIKKHAVVYVVGAIVMFSTTGILEIIRRLASALDTNTGGADGEEPEIDAGGKQVAV